MYDDIRDSHCLFSLSRPDSNGEAVAIDLGPELPPAFLRVDQSPKTQHRSSTRLLPLGPAAAHPHLHDGLAGSLRHATADWQIGINSLGIVHLLVMVAEVSDGFGQFLLHGLAQPCRRQALHLPKQFLGIA